MHNKNRKMPAQCYRRPTKLYILFRSAAVAAILSSFSRALCSSLFHRNQAPSHLQGNTLGKVRNIIGYCAHTAYRLGLATWFFDKANEKSETTTANGIRSQQTHTHARTRANKTNTNKHQKIDEFIFRFQFGLFS